MGTGIHGFVEFRNKEKNEKEWHSFSYDELFLRRDYVMFYILARVRSHAPHSFKPKGKIPVDEISDCVKEARMFYIEDDIRYSSLRSCTLEDALEYKKKYGCRIYKRDKKPYLVDDPDYHTDSWLSFSEYEQALKYYTDYTKKKPFVDYVAVYEIMKVYENENYETRFVYFFDN